MSKRLHKDFQSLSWFNLESWAGSRIVSRGKSYQRSKSVRDLAITESGELVAWVEGSTTYATKVSFDKGALASVCSCPYYSACKHAVAVILEYLDCIENRKNVPQTGKDDERLMLFEIRDELNYKSRIETGKPSALVKTIEKEIAKASSEPGWRNHWEHTGYIPDYSRVRSGLQKLLDEGHADEVVHLGEKLFSAGITQVEQSHDEGETVDEVADSLKIVFKALGECSLEDIDKMERAVDFRLRDEYGLCHGLEVFWKRRFSKKNWGLLADRLLKRLSDVKYGRQEDSYSRNYRRDRLTGEILHALENAGRQDEVLSLCRQEAEKTHSYGRLVKHLRKAGHATEAEEWIRKGIAATSKKWPGIAGSLKGELVNMRSLKKDWLFVAALHADDFCEGPSLKTFEDLKKVSEKARVWSPVREAVLYFLETGKRPGKSSSDWPLPDTGIETSDRSRHGKAVYLRPPVPNDLFTNILSSPKACPRYPCFSFMKSEFFITMEWGGGANTSISLLDEFHIEKCAIHQEYIGKQTAIVIILGRRLKLKMYGFPS